MPVLLTTLSTFFFLVCSLLSPVFKLDSFLANLTVANIRMCCRLYREGWPSSFHARFSCNASHPPVSYTTDAAPPMGEQRKTQTGKGNLRTWKQHHGKQDPEETACQVGGEKMDYSILTLE